MRCTVLSKNNNLVPLIDVSYRRYQKKVNFVLNCLLFNFTNTQAQELSYYI